MFGMGMPEIMLILAVALIIIGPKKLPELAKTIGRAMGEIRNATRDFKRSIDLNGDLQDVKDSLHSMKDFSPDDSDKSAYTEVDTTRTADKPVAEPETASEQAATDATTKPAFDPETGTETASGVKSHG